MLKYYELGSLKNIPWHFTSLVMIYISEQSPILPQNRKIYQKNFTNQNWKLSNVQLWPKWNNGNGTNKKMLNSKLCRNFLVLYQTLAKSFKIMQYAIHRYCFSLNEVHWISSWMLNTPLLEMTSVKMQTNVSKNYSATPLLWYPCLF